MDGLLLMPFRHGLGKGKILVVAKNGGRITDERFSRQARIGQLVRPFVTSLTGQHGMNLSEITRVRKKTLLP
jgi:hypothetical protein